MGIINWFYHQNARNLTASSLWCGELNLWNERNEGNNVLSMCTLLGRGVKKMWERCWHWNLSSISALFSSFRYTDNSPLPTRYVQHEKVVSVMDIDKRLTIVDGEDLIGPERNSMDERLVWTSRHLLLWPRLRIATRSVILHHSHSAQALLRLGTGSDMCNTFCWMQAGMANTASAYLDQARAQKKLQRCGQFD